jgi:hypothetical protein
MGKRGFFILSIIAFALLAGGMVPVSVLEIKDGKSGKSLFYERAGTGDIFLFSYIHSVDKTPVEGTFLVEKGGVLRILETRFSSYGPGLPNVAGKTLRKNGWFITEGGERLDKFKFFFSPINRPVLKFKDQSIAFGDEKEEGGLLEISIRHYPFILHVFKEL